jgi:hypothetical protein
MSGKYESEMMGAISSESANTVYRHGIRATRKADAEIEAKNKMIAELRSALYAMQGGWYPMKLAELRAKALKLAEYIIKQAPPETPIVTIARELKEEGRNEN